MVIKEVNANAKEIAQINGKIKEMEDQIQFMQANELRDRRDELEFNIQSLLGANVFKNHLWTKYPIAPRMADFDDEYVLNVAHGFNIVDGAMHHPIIVKTDENAPNLAHVYFQGDDFKTIEITDKLTQGKAGSRIALFGDGTYDAPLGKLQDLHGGLLKQPTIFTPKVPHTILKATFWIFGIPLRLLIPPTTLKRGVLILSCITQRAKKSCAKLST